MVAALLLRGLTAGARFVPKIAKGLFGTIPRAITTTLTLPTAIGFVSTKEGRALARKFIDPTSRIRFGKTVATDPLRAVKDVFRDKTPLEGLQSIPILQSIPGQPGPFPFKSKTIIERAKEKIPDVPAPPSILVPAGIGAAIAGLGALLIQRLPTGTGQVGLQVSEEPTLGAVPKPKEPVKEKPLTPMMIKNTFNPEINIKLSKSRKFINQQLLIRK